MILEGLVTTRNADGAAHLAPMGPAVDGPDFTRFLLKPFATSQTGKNLRAHPEGVFHVTDDALLLARAAIGKLAILPDMIPAIAVAGWVLADCCRWYEFRITEIDDSRERLVMTAGVTHVGRGRDWFGFNRAKHAIVEAAILATRVGILPANEIAIEFARLQVPIDKTGGPAEREAYELLSDYLAAAGVPR